jgi:hypothetical protein
MFPTPPCKKCKDALFAVGAGTCPGAKYSHEKVVETKVEMLCVGREAMERSVKAVKEAHPYEVVAYCVVKVEDI